LSNPTYLWTIQHKTSGEKKRFIPIVNDSIFDNPVYDSFSFYVSATTESYLNPVVLNLKEGQWYLKIYEQVSTTNLLPELAHDYVYEGTIYVPGEQQQTKPTTYSGGTQPIIYKIYE
jgi:hypothetical protein